MGFPQKSTSLGWDGACDGQRWAACVFPQAGVVQVPTISVCRIVQRLVAWGASCSHTDTVGLLGTWFIQLPGDANPVSAHTSTEERRKEDFLKACTRSLSFGNTRTGCPWLSSTQHCMGETSASLSVLVYLLPSLW